MHNYLERIFMERFQLTQKEEIELRIAHRVTKKKREADRIKTLILLSSGWTYAQASKALLLDEETLRNYVKRYRTGGLKKLLKDNNKGSHSKLICTEIDKLCIHLEETLYTTVEDIVAYVYKQYKVSYSVSGMTDLLNREGFVYKKTKIIPGKADAKKQKEFIKTYEQMKA